MQVVIEMTRGQYRIHKDGSVRRYAADYGEISGTKGADGEPIDVYCGLFPNSSRAFVVNQYRHDGTFDEHKVMLDFYDQEQAAAAYRLTTGRTPEIYPVTRQQLEWWLTFGNHKQPVNMQSFPYDSENSEMTQTPDWTDENRTAGQLLYAWRNADTYGELLEAATFDSVMESAVEDYGLEPDEAAAFDALAVPNRKLERTANLLGAAFNRAPGSLKVADNGIHISKPLKQNGTTNIVAMFEMTDGQTVSVFFHNPDTTPQKIAPEDVMISWKWLLNRKDITIVVAKENGKDLPLPVIARRVMALVEKNTARFAKANAQRAERLENIARMEAQIEEKQNYLNELTEKLAAKQNGNMPSENGVEPQAETQSEENPEPTAETQPELNPEPHQESDSEADPIAGDEDETNGGNTDSPAAGRLKTEPLDESKLKPLVVPEDADNKTVRKAIENYLKQLQGKTVQTVDGKTVRFSKQSTKHIANDAIIKKEVVPKAVAHAVEVLQTGDFIERQEVYKERYDFVAFHVYRKWVDLGNQEINMQVKAAELPDGELVAGDGLLAYSAKEIDDKTKEADQEPTSFAADSTFSTSGNPGTNLSAGQSITGTSDVMYGCNNTAVLDGVQDNEPYIFIEILEIREKAEPQNNQLSDSDSDMPTGQVQGNNNPKNGEQSIPQSASDTAYLQAVIDGKINVLEEEDTDTRLLDIYERAGDDKALNDLLEQAADVFKQAVIRQAHQQLGMEGKK